ncbi:uncharacterized protein LOC126483869 isoform X1 [Schistocerca serialis cubense]|uniref:uncharacterized protein LOC126483869 isoform X1 n=3 Tax=Schistocerca serialis cubense TaxID=2023355 RepID=UPI00214EBDFF|nr:uncharacterized protein LOC126483869 isoform X1 [Schistocerca serialis cubense]
MPHQAEKISLRPRPIAPKPVMFLISPETAVVGTDSTQDNPSSIRLTDLPSIDETMESTPLVEENTVDDIKNRDKTSSVNENDFAETKDNEDDITALVVASSNIRSSPKGRTSAAGRKKSKYIRDVETSLSLLLPDSIEVAEEKAFSFAQAYFLKVKETLEGKDSDTYQLFLEVLNDFGSKIATVPDLYRKVSSVLHNYPDLVSEFVVFLLPEQAMQCGKLMEYLILTKMSNFFKRLEVYFKRQPQQLRKIYTALTLLSTQTNVTMNDVRSAVLPLLRGNSFLIESLLEIIPQEHLPDSLSTDFDEMGCAEVDSDNLGDDDQMETLIVPDQEDKYGSDTCICTCHNSTKQKYRSRIHHCVPCGTKFIHGRVFMQIGKVLRPAKVIFPDCDMTACIERLAPKQCIKKTRKKDSGHNEPGALKETSPSKATLNPTVMQHNSCSQSDISNLAGKDAVKPKNIKPRAVNRNNKVLEGIRPDTSNTRNNLRFSQATRSSRSGTLKVCIKVPKLSGENKTGNSSLSKRGSVKRSRSSSRNRVRQKSLESGTKSPPPSDKQTLDGACSTCITSTQEKNEKIQDCQLHKPPAKKQCRLMDNVSTVESVVHNNSIEVSLNEVGSCNVSLDMQLLKQPSVTLKCITESDETVHCSPDDNTLSVDSTLSRNEDSFNCGDSCASSIMNKVTDTAPVKLVAEMEQHNQQNEGTSPCLGSDEVQSSSKDSNVIEPLEQEYGKSSEESVSVSNSHQVIVERNTRDDLAFHVCSSDSISEDTTQMTWTKEEDKVILKMFQQECATERILYMIRQQLPQRSVEQIQNRFQTLMNLLQKMTGVRMDDDKGV